MRRRLGAVLALLLLTGADYPPPQAMRQSGAEQWFGNVTLTDQNGRPVRLYEDLMAGQVVVVNAFYTGCRAACPQAMGTLSQLQAKLAIDGVPARFISITVDPEHDTPDRVGLYARSLEAGANWNMLTGDSPSVAQVRTGHRSGRPQRPSESALHGEFADRPVGEGVQPGAAG
jgi:protein SCO1/2